MAKPDDAGLCGPPAALDRCERLGASGSSSRASTTSTDQPRRAIRDTDWRTLRTAPALEREALRIDDGLAAHLQRAQAQLRVDVEVAVRRAGQCDRPAVAAGEAREAVENLGRAARRADRVADDDRGAADDPVGEHAAGGEVEALVRAQRERVQRVGRMGAHQRGGAQMLQCGVAVGGRRRAWASSVPRRTLVMAGTPLRWRWKLLRPC